MKIHDFMSIANHHLTQMYIENNETFIDFRKRSVKNDFIMRMNNTLSSDIFSLVNLSDNFVYRSLRTDVYVIDNAKTPAVEFIKFIKACDKVWNYYKKAVKSSTIDSSLDPLSIESQLIKLFGEGLVDISAFQGYIIKRVDVPLMMDEALISQLRSRMIKRRTDIII